MVPENNNYLKVKSPKIIWMLLKKYLGVIIYFPKRSHQVTLYVINSISSLSSNRILYNYHSDYTCGIINTDTFLMSMYHKIGLFVKKHTEGKEKERKKMVEKGTHRIILRSIHE